MNEKLTPEQEQEFADWMEGEIFDGDNYLPKKVIKGLYRIIDNTAEDVCPECGGYGEIYTDMHAHYGYDPDPCPKCGGKDA